MKKLLFILLITIPFIVLGQEWSNTFNYGGEKGTRGYSIKQTSDGNYILGGGVQDINGNRNGIVLKINTSGTLDWNQIFGSDAVFYSIDETNDGGYVLCGVKDNYPLTDYDVWLLKTDLNGNLIWEQNFDFINGNDVARSVKQTNDGGFIITGRSGSSPSPSGVECDVWLIKTDGNGNLEWKQVIDSDFDSYLYGGYSVEQTSDGGYIVSGISTLGYPCLIKADDNGNQEWLKTFGNIGEIALKSVQQTNDGGYILTGGTEDGDIWLIKTDNNGNQQWDKNFGNSGYDTGNSVQQTSDGGYVITGMMYSDSLFCLIKTDGSGNLEWNKNYGCCEGFSVQQTNDGGYILSGEKNDYIHVIKTNSQGNITSANEISLPNPKRKLNKTINLQGQEIRTQPNQSFIKIYDDGSSEKKLIIDK